MDTQLKTLLNEIHQSGILNDQQVEDKAAMMLNITPDTGAFLSILVKATNAQAILEIGTSNGYSTLWLAEAASHTGGQVTTIEHNEAKAARARIHFEQSPFSSLIKLIVADAGLFLLSHHTSFFDFIFLDANRSQYMIQWPLIKECLNPGGLIVVDNAISHAHELASFRTMVEQTPGYSTSLVAVGKGDLLIWKSRQITEVPT